jgi:uncharacterized protein
MPLPGPVITQSSTPPTRSAPTDIGVWFVAGLTEKGQLVPIEIHSMADYVAKLGARVSYGVLYDALEAFFAEGGDTAVVSRVVGPAPVSATVNVFDQSGSVVPGDVALVATAESPGDWANALNVNILAGDQGGEFKVQVTHDTDTTVNETSPSLVDRDAAVAWSQTSAYIRLTLGASNEDPRVQGPLSLATGTDDRASIVDAQWLAALNRFSKDLGPGQVSAPGRSTAAGHSQLLSHAQANNRFALVDFADTATVATLTAAAAANRALATARYGGGFAPWATIPGSTPGTTRLVPYSAIQAGLEARNAATGRSANEPAAGELGKARYAIGLSQLAWTDTDRTTLNDNGVNVARVMFDGVRSYGYRTFVDPNGALQDWVALSGARLAMQLSALAYQIAEGFEFRQIDGAKHTISEFGGALTGMLLPFYDQGALFGSTPEEAFLVDVGDSVNTPATIAARELRARLAVRMSPFAERVLIDIAKVPTTQALA